MTKHLGIERKRIQGTSKSRRETINGKKTQRMSVEEQWASIKLSIQRSAEEVKAMRRKKRIMDDRRYTQVNGGEKKSEKQ